MKESCQTRVGHRCFETSAIVAVLGISAVLAWRIMAAAHDFAAWATVASAIVLGYLLSDLVSGFVHWLADRFGSPETPIFGANFVRPFREHHEDPLVITRHDFIETNGNNCIVSLPVLVLALLLPLPDGSYWRLFGVGLALSLSLFAFATNQIHKWAHMEQVPAVVRVLQQAHLILSPQHHDLHHSAPFETHYCITTGWLDLPLEKLKVFDALEQAVRRAQTASVRALRH
jgi:plasmanylethanolamine desaturase